MPELVGLTTDELKTLAESHGEKPFRGKQLATWLYQKSEPSLAAMTDLPKAFRAKLEAEGYQGGAMTIHRVQA